MWGVACGGDSCGLMYRGLGIWVGYADGGDSWGGDLGGLVVLMGARCM